MCACGGQLWDYYNNRAGVFIISHFPGIFFLYFLFSRQSTIISNCLFFLFETTLLLYILIIMELNNAAAANRLGNIID